MDTKIASIAILVTGISIALCVFYTWLRWRRVVNWRRTDGLLVGTRLKVGKKRMWPASLDLYFPVVEYEYTHDGRTYTGRRITVHDKRLASVEITEAKAILERIEQSPDVYVNPSNPDESVLVNRLEWMHYDLLLTYFAVGVLFALAGAGLLMLA